MKREVYKKRIPWNKGKKLSLESREKMKLGQLNRKLNYGYINSPQARKKRLEAISQRGSFKETSIEFKVYNELKRTGFLFEKQKLINGKFLVDAFIPSLNLVIEADGCYWHKCEKCGYNGRKLEEIVDYRPEPRREEIVAPTAEEREETSAPATGIKQNQSEEQTKRDIRPGRLYGGLSLGYRVLQRNRMLRHGYRSGHHALQRMRRGHGHMQKAFQRRYGWARP